MVSALIFSSKDADPLLVSFLTRFQDSFKNLLLLFEEV